MKKKILSAMFAVAIMAVAGYNVYMNQTKNGMSELALANIEALAYDSEWEHPTMGPFGSEQFCSDCYNEYDTKGVMFYCMDGVGDCVSSPADKCVAGYCPPDMM